jgi:hypothetical protein
VSTDDEAVASFVSLLERVGVPYMLAGSIASSHHGLPRATNDADVVIDPTPESFERLLASLAEDGYYADAGVARDALGRRGQLRRRGRAAGLGRPPRS